LYQSYFKSLGITDVHTHNKNAESSAVYNILPQAFSDFQFKNNHYYSVGIHPWYIDLERIESQFFVLQKLLKEHSNIILIGECGLDKLKGIEIQIQEAIFKRQLTLAKHFQKPIIIHCVKSFQEILAIIKKEKFTLPFIFHGFNKSVELAKQIIDAGGAISVNFTRQINQDLLDKYLEALPNDHVLFESD
jgi:TatD DNase family protein